MLTTTLFSAVCALALNVSAASIQADTTNIYFIDNEHVTDFDGSQLVGKTISSYRIMTAESTAGESASVTKMHVILTDGNQLNVEDLSMSGKAMSIKGSNGSNKLTISGTSTHEGVVQVSHPEVFIDGKKSSYEKLSKLNPKRIANITVYAAGSESAASYTDDKTKGVVVVTLK